ncbi:MAG: tetratricopeptide repeat protein, partial [bacterium]
VLGVVFLAKRDYDQAIKLGRKAVQLSPNGAEGTAALGLMYNYAGRPREAIEQLGHAMRLSPRHPVWYSYQKGLAQYLVKDYAQAIQHFEELLKRDPEAPRTRMLLTASYVGAKRLPEARGAAKVFRERNPDMDPAKELAQAEPFRDPAVIEGILEQLKIVDLE